MADQPPSPPFGESPDQPLDPAGDQPSAHPSSQPSEPADGTKPSAADRLLGRTTTRIVKETVQKARQESDKTIIMVVIIAAAVLIGIVGVALLNARKASQPQQMVYTPQFDVGMSSQEEIRSFTTKTSKEVTEINRQISELTKTMQGLIDRQDKTEKFVRDTMDQAKAAFERSGQDKVQRLEELARITQAQQVDPRTAGIIEEFRRSLANFKESPAEAKARAVMLLRQAGVPENQIRNILAEAAQQAGRVAVGDIAEPPPSKEEVASLPAWVQPHVPALQNRLGVIALTEGRFYPEQVTSDVRDFLRAKEHERGGEISDALVIRLSEVARVRRENLTPEMEEVLPFLITARDQGKVARADKVAIAGLVWRSKDRYPSTITAGQLLSLCHVVARTVGAVSTTDDQGFRPIDDASQGFALDVVTSAVVNGIQLGQNQSQQTITGGRALGNYLDTNRLTATEEQKTVLVRRAMATAFACFPAATQPEKPATAPTQPAPRDARSTTDAGETLLFFGPLRLDRGRVQRSLVYAIPALMESNAVDLHGAKGAAALVSAIEQVPRVIGEALNPYLGKPLGGKDFYAVALPQLIYAIRMGESLGSIPMPVSPEKQNEASREANLVRGAAIGTIFGPLLHDEAKAKAVASDATAQLEANPPLTPTIAASLAKVPDDRPVVAILLAMDAVRPGRFAYPPERFQEVVTTMRGMFKLARQLRDQLRDQFQGTQEGVFDENMRVLIPMSVASHDDVQVPVADLVTLVRADLLTYT
ncbi:MAG TPA: hypothetical protein VHX44_07065, partial [Planctomycetota bacterium]|nr:hypothetical protein [Planctomycetota bacterium]